jgi:carbon monoxide dehydrogenase subunit G
MKLEQSFEVKAPIDRVWSVLIDLEQVAPCLPGAAITERDDEGTYHGTFQVKLGPTTASYRGQIRLEEVDESTHTATLKAHGSDKRGQGGANATIVNKLVETDDGTRVDAVTDLTITGRLARFGRGGMIQDVSNRLMRDFADCLQKGLTGDGAGAEGAAAAGAATTAAGAPAADNAATEGTAPEGAEPAITPADAVASAAAEARPEDSATEGKSPEEVGAPASAEEPAPAPSQPGAGAPSTTPPPPPPHPRPFTPPPAAQPIRGIPLFFSVLWERIKRLFGRGRK